jgi:hypothetical protein
VNLDCQSWRNCDRDHYRREIPWVNWVREPQDAQVHIILTSQQAGSGGLRYTFDFIGREGLDGMGDEYTFTSSQAMVEEEVVGALTSRLQQGLVRYAVAAGYGDRFEVRALESQVAAQDEQEVVGPAQDPWNFWVFDVDANASLEEEDISSQREFGFGVNANRTTEAWKFNVRANGNWDRREFELSDTTIVDDRSRWNLSSSAIKSLGDHWGVGAEVEANNSTQLNRELLVAVGAGAEWNYFPYSESNRRELLAQYVVGVEHVNYEDTTVFEVLQETVLRHEVELRYEARETWGNANFNAGVRQYLDRPDSYSYGFGGFLRYRLFRGFSVNVNGRYEVVRDQIYLPLSELSDDDILLGRRELPTDSEFSVRVGLSYSFGSIYNNVVNPRFGRGVR